MSRFGDLIGGKAPAAPAPAPEPVVEPVVEEAPAPEPVVEEAPVPEPAPLLNNSPRKLRRRSSK
jgi:hypothetical protein